MKYIKLFDKDADYQSLITTGGGVTLPNVSHTIDENKVYYNPYVKPVELKNVIEYETDTKYSDPIKFGTAYRDTGGSELAVVSYLYDNNGNKLLIQSNTYENGIGKLVLSGNPVKFDYTYFAGYESLYVLSFPSTITSVPVGCIAYTPCGTLTFKSVTPPTVTFTDNDKEYLVSNWLKAYYSMSGMLSIYVPSESVDAYKKAQYWSNYASIIKAIQ